MTGKTIKPGLTIEIFTDAGTQGQFFEGQTIGGSDGNFTFTLPATSVWRAVPGKITAIAIDSQGNASPFSTTTLTAPVVTLPTPTPVPTPIGTSTSKSYLPLITK